MKTVNDVILSAGNMASATLTSDAIDLSNMGLAAIQAVYTGSPVGSLKLQASNDNSSYVDLPDPVAISAAGSSMIELTDIGYKWLRAVYTKTSGTGSLTITANAKGF